MQVQLAIDLICYNCRQLSLVLIFCEGKALREFLSIAADIATIVTAFCAAGVLIKLNVNINSSTSKRADQSAKGTSNTQNVSQ